MSKAIRWQIHFHEAKPASENPKHYRVDIYDEQDGSWSGVTQLTAGDNPFTTTENNSDDFFCPVRSQTGTLQICTAIPGGGTISIADLSPETNVSRPVKMVSISGSTETIQWQGFLSNEAYSQDYIGTVQIISIPVISVLEAMRYVWLSSYWFDQIGSDTIANIINSIRTNQIGTDLEMTVYTSFSQASNAILSKYIFVSQFFSYEKSVSNGNSTYIYTAATVYDVFERICRFMGWCVREQGYTFYFERIGSDELGTTTADMANLTWKGTGHKYDILQGAKTVKVEANLAQFDTHFEMPECPITGLLADQAYSFPQTNPSWYYNKYDALTYGKFRAINKSKCFLARFFGLYTGSTSYPWNNKYGNLGFENAIYMEGEKFAEGQTNYIQRCTITSVQKCSIIARKGNSIEDMGSFVVKIKEETAAALGVNGYMRFGFKFNNKFYSGASVGLWTNSAVAIKMDMQNGVGEMEIPVPYIGDTYTFLDSYIELYLYNDFDISNRTTAVISDISVTYKPPYKKLQTEASRNTYVAHGNSFARDEISVQLELASSLGNINALSHVYGVTQYHIGVGDVVDYYEPITELTYNLSGSTTTTRRPETDLLNRLAAYYGAARQRLELEVAHPTAAPLPLLRLNGINDGKVYLPLSEQRDWRNDVCKLTCFECPT